MDNHYEIHLDGYSTVSATPIKAGSMVLSGSPGDDYVDIEVDSDVSRGTLRFNKWKLAKAINALI